MHKCTVVMDFTKNDFTTKRRKDLSFSENVQGGRSGKVICNTSRYEIVELGCPSILNLTS